MKPPELLDKLLADIPADKKSDAAVSRALAGSRRWEKDWEWLNSWFEDSEEALQAAKAKEPSKLKLNTFFATSLPLVARDGRSCSPGRR